MVEERPQVDLMAFRIEEVSRLCNLSPRRIRAWQASLYRPHWRSGLYSFRDLVALRTLGALRAKHVSKRKLEEIGAALARKYEEPWSRIKFGVGPKGKVYYWDPDGQVWIGWDGQTITEIALDHFAHELEREVRRSRQRNPSMYGKFEKTRGVCGGRLRIAGTRITLDTLRPYIEDGSSDVEILREFPLLNKKDLVAVRQKLAS